MAGNISLGARAPYEPPPPMYEEDPPAEAPIRSRRASRQSLQRFGSFVNPLLAWNS